MLLRRTSEQEDFRATTARFLKDRMPVARVRALRGDPVGFEPDYWRRGAELGWTSLLVDEAHGGGSISGDGLVDLTLVAHEFGVAGAPGPLTSVNVVAAALSASAAHPDVLAELMGGTAVVAWCQEERAGYEGIELTIAEEGDELVLSGTKRPVEAAGAAAYLLVTGRTGDGLTQVLVPADAPGITITPMRTTDLTRRFDVVRFDDVRVSRDALVGEPGGADAEVARQLRLAAVIATAESVGAMQVAFELTLQWTRDRYSFGRPLASYQALKHRMADMRAWLEASHAIADEAAEAMASGDPRAAELVSAAKHYVGEWGTQLLQHCIHLHGGLGVTFEHDLHIYLRRHIVNRALYGTPSDHRRALADLVEQDDVA